MLTWRSIRESEGRAMVGLNFGGRPFECGEAGPSNFFRGHYADGGDLVACTTGADGRTLVGRFNGNETFKSGSFEVTDHLRGAAHLLRQVLRGRRRSSRTGAACSARRVR